VGIARFAVACAAASLAACGLAANGLQGTGDDGGMVGSDATAIDDAVTPAEAASGDVGAPEAGAKDVAASDVAPIDAAPVDGCVPKSPTEDCTNGVDDNCDGLVDCADPQCTTQGYTCVTPAPMGWDVSPLDSAGQPGCPMGLMQRDVTVDPTGLSMPAMCSCSCTATAAPSCEQGTIAVSAGPTNTCGAGSMNYMTNGGACDNQAINPAAFAQITPPAATGGTCTPSETTTKPPTGGTQGQVCTGESAFGAGCTGGQECALVPAGSLACIHHGGANMACPAGPYTMQHAVGVLQDGRGCAACTCMPPTATCNPGSWAFFTNAGCPGMPSMTLTANDQCNPTQAMGAYQSNQFSASVATATCAQPAPPPPTGMVQLTQQDTICCE
jgi:hypothetical protein